jgi:hypothetical protein
MPVCGANPLLSKRIFNDILKPSEKQRIGFPRANPLKRKI